MADTTRFHALIQTGGRLRLNDPDWAVLDAAITAWAKRTTDPASPRVDDLLRDKQRVVYAFFRWVQKRPQQVTTTDVAAWQDDLRLERDPDTGRRRFAPATVYAMVSRVSSFYHWAQKNAKRADVSLANPVDAVRPKAPKPFQGKSTKALTDGTRPHDMSTFWEEIPPHSPDTYVDVLRAATLDAIERPQQSQDPAWECAR